MARAVSQSELLAQAIADRLRESGDIIACILFGSVARSDDDAWSDLDLLVVGKDPKLTTTILSERLPESLRPEGVSLLYLSESALQRALEGDALFIEHLRREGHVLFDRGDVWKRITKRRFEPRKDVPSLLELERRRLAPYRDLRRFNENYLFCLSQMYSVAKSVVMLGLAEQGRFEFNRDLAFADFRRRYPGLSTEMDHVEGLRAFYQMVARREAQELPFPYKRSRKRVKDALAALDTLIGAVESKASGEAPR